MPTGSAAALGPDLSRWQFWWEFNKDEHLALRDAVAARRTAPGSDDAFLAGAAGVVDLERPTRDEIRDTVAPALLAILEQEHQRDIVSGAMMALAKCGTSGAALSAFRSRLESPDQEVRETAALCLGLNGDPTARRDLLALFDDSALGRELVGQQRVDTRTRAFAGYGLALLAETRDEVTQRWAQRSFGLALDPLVDVPWDVRVAALQGCRRLAASVGDTDAGKDLRDHLFVDVWAYYMADLGPGEARIQAHAPAALAACVGRGKSDRHEQVLKRLADDLQGHRGIALAQSAALAMGDIMVDPAAHSGHASYGESLVRAASANDDLQTRYFATLALARFDWAPARAKLRRMLEDGAQLPRTWSAIAMGFAARGGRVVAPEDVQRIATAFRAARNPEERAGFAVALGLLGARASAPFMREQLAQYSHQDDYAGYLCIALSLLDDRASLPQIRNLLVSASRRPELLIQCSVALGLLGDGRTVSLLIDQLDAGSGVAVIGASASALGRIGDRRSIEPLLELLRDTSRQPLARAFAAVALGGIADPRPLPWNAGFAAGINYRASVSTLTDQAMGILDLF